jgi:small-conductance mechanosensitive channel
VGAKLLRDPKTFVSFEKIDAIVQLDPALFILFLALTAWFVYRLFLKDVNLERHRNLQGLFRNLGLHSAVGIILFACFDILRSLESPTPLVERLLPYVGFLALLWGAIVFIKTCRIFLFEYLFFLNMQVGVPLLLVNLFTLAVSVVIGSWILSSVFEFHLISLVATSAVLSIVLGLALQDTLGNLFAGVALQLDKPYSIGDWIEVLNGNQKVVGMVQEITWRATLLISITDEIIIIPNRTVAQSQVSNFSVKGRPIARSLVFRIPYGQDLGPARQALLKAASSVKGICEVPEPIVLVNEATESWIQVKLIYSIEDFGRQFGIADQMYSAALTELSNAGVETASPRLEIHRKAA